MIGKIYTATFPFYNVKTDKMSYKARPLLIIGYAGSNDYIVLPVSTITRQENRDMIYDIEIDPAQYPETNLNKVSFVRTHKQTTVHESNLHAFVGDIKTNYEELFLQILEKLEQFNDSIIKNAL